MRAAGGGPGRGGHRREPAVRRALVTGATGFVGANVARRLLDDGHEVHLLVRPGHDPWRIEAIAGDVVLQVAALEDEEGVGRAVRDARPDWVFNLAAAGAYSWQVDLRAMIDTNFVGTVNLLEAAMRRGFEAFVHTGSSSEYGVKAAAPAEDDAVEPNSHYAVTKAAATLYCAHAGRSREAPVRVLRLYSAYGPWEEPRRLIPTLARRGLDGGLPPLAGPAIARDYVYVDDVVDAHLAAASVAGQRPGAVYNVATGRQTSLREVVEVARRELGLDVEPQWGSMPDRSWDCETWVGDPARIAAALGWRAGTAVPEGFRRTVAWLRDTPGMREAYERRGAPAAQGKPT